MTDSEEREGSLNVRIASPGDEIGIWADQAMIHHTPHGFCLDFICTDPSDDPLNLSGVLASRVRFSPLLAQQLAEMLQTNWERYAEKAMPPEAEMD